MLHCSVLKVFSLPLLSWASCKRIQTWQDRYSCKPQGWKYSHRSFNKHRRPTKHVSYFAQRSRLLLPLEAGKNIKLKKILSKLILKFNLLDLDRLFAPDLKYLRKAWDLLCISYLSKLIENTLSFVLNLVLRTLEIVF